MEPSSIVAVRKLSRSFGKFQALRDVSMEVHRGEIHVLLGHNGAGKTTLIRILLGLIKATAGFADVHGLDAWKAREGRLARQKTGVLFEPNALYEDLTALENLEFFARIYRMDLQRWLERVSELLVSVKLYDRRHERVVKWSAGMKRKLSIIRAIQHLPKLAILDEPTAGLDVQSRANIRDAIQKFQSDNLAILIASQDLAEVQRVATHVTLLRSGVVLYAGSIEEFYSQAALRRFHGSPEAVSNFTQTLPFEIELVREEADVLGASVVVRVKDHNLKTIAPSGIGRNARAAGRHLPGDGQKLKPENAKCGLTLELFFGGSTERIVERCGTRRRRSSLFLFWVGLWLLRC